MEGNMTPPSVKEGSEANVEMTPPTHATIELFCGVFRTQGVIVPVTARLDEKVRSVQEKLAGELGVRPHELLLYLAKKTGENGQNKWIAADKKLGKLLLGGLPKDDTGTPPFTKLYPPNKLEDIFGQRIPDNVVHVLVELTGTSKKQKIGSAPSSFLDEQKASARKSGGLPQKTEDFLKLFDWNDANCGQLKGIKAIGDIVGFTGSKFYVRREILCVLKAFRDAFNEKLFEDTNAKFEKQFVCMGSPGTGKSCILALICFYLAIVNEVPVVWHRHVTEGKALPVTRLFDQGKYYEWLDEDTDIYTAIFKSQSRDESDHRCWFCIDGMNQTQLKNKNLGTCYTLLATSGQLKLKGEGSVDQVTCLLPYWREDDLEDLARKAELDNPADRYFVSGGSVRFFVIPIGVAEKQLHAAFREISTATAGSLLTPNGTGSQEHIDRIRMMGVRDATDPEQYTDLFYWRAFVSSKLALNTLSTIMGPDFFHQFVMVAKDMNDPRLMDVAREQLFRSQVRQQHKIGISYMKYDNLNRKTNTDRWRGVMRQDVGTVTFGRSSGSDEDPTIQRKGNTLEEYAAVMAEWAGNPDMMDYWIPASSTCKTVDAVAKWRFEGKKVTSAGTYASYTEERFCLLQLTMAKTHTCKESVLSTFAKPFLDANKKVCYMALLCVDEADEKRSGNNLTVEEKNIKRMERFRLSPVVIEKEKKTEEAGSGTPPAFPLHVATYTLL